MSSHNVHATDVDQEQPMFYVNIRDIPYIGQMSEGLKALMRNIIEPGLVAEINGLTCVYCAGVGYWSPIHSSQGLREVSNAAQASNATVNYAAAAQPYIPVLQARCRHIRFTDVSFCVGHRRLAYDRQVLVDAQGVASEAFDLMSVDVLPHPMPGDDNGELRGVSLMPMACTKMPQRVRLAHVPRGWRYLAQCFEGDGIDDLKAILWCVSRAMMDPKQESKVIVLYGPGGNGKSVLIDVVRRMCGAQICSATSADLLCDVKAKLSSYTASELSCSRMATSGDVDLSRGLNLPVLKTMTGGDTVTISGSTVTLGCTVMMGSNFLPDVKQRGICDESMARRLVFVPMTVPVSMRPGLIQLAGSQEEYGRLMGWSLCSYIDNPDSMPMSKDAFLMTMCLSSYAQAKHVLTPSDSWNVHDAAMTTIFIAACRGMAVDRCARQAALLCPQRVRTVLGIKLITGFAYQL